MRKIALSFWLLLTVAAPPATRLSAQTLTTLATFSSNAPAPNSPLIVGPDGNFWGTAIGVDSAGAVFKITPSGGAATVYAFGTNPNDGSNPYGGLVLANDGNLYGTTKNGGANGSGTVFQLTPSGTLTTLYSFGATSADGANPEATLIQGTDGALYGTTFLGGMYGNGTIFRITPAGGYNILHNFQGPEGLTPATPLMQASDGNLYGAAGLGGANSGGTVFKITTAGALTTLYSFNPPSDGADPYSGLTQGSDGYLYGTTSSAGPNGFGTAYRISTAGAFTAIYAFGGASGASPRSGLVQGPGGVFYGVAPSGGANNDGTIFQLNAAGSFTTLYNFSGATDGLMPYATPLLSSSGALYGTTSGGGPGGAGTAFSLAIGSSPLPAPTITSNGVVPVYSTSTSIQPGEWASIYGSNLAAVTATWSGNFPTALGGVTVMVDNKPAYLWYVSSTQINFQAPDDPATGTVPVSVTTASGTAMTTVTLAAASPSFLLLDTKHVAGIILRSDGSGAYGNGTYDILGPTGTSLGYATVAAKAGDTVELYGTGFGPTTPTVASGQPYSGAASTTTTVTLLINNVGVTPSFAGLSGAGLDQINITVPAGLGTGDVPLSAMIDGVQTQSNVVISLQ